MIKDKSTVVMFFDVSSISTGWATMNLSGKLLKYGAINPKGNVPERLVETRKQTVELLQVHQPTFIGIEDMIAFRNGKVTKMLNYFSGVVYEACYEYNQNEVYFIASSSIKKYIDINSRALKLQGYTQVGIKELIVKQIEERFNIVMDKTTTNYRDMADAIAGVGKLYATVKNFNQGE